MNNKLRICWYALLRLSLLLNSRWFQQSEQTSNLPRPCNSIYINESALSLIVCWILQIWNATRINYESRISYPQIVHFSFFHFSFVAWWECQKHPQQCCVRKMERSNVKTTNRKCLLIRLIYVTVQFKCIINISSSTRRKTITFSDGVQPFGGIYEWIRKEN